MESEMNATWNPQLEAVIKKEGENAECYYVLHHRSSQWASLRADALNIPAIILSTITGFLSATNVVPVVALGSISVLVGILSTINSYFKFSQRSESHRIISLIYLKLYKTIECELSLPINQRTDANTLLKELRTSMNTIQEQAPVIPESIIMKFKEQFSDGVTARPIVANGLDSIVVFRENKSPMNTPVIKLLPPPTVPPVRRS